jgi:hypothetical protein
LQNLRMGFDPFVLWDTTCNLVNALLQTTLHGHLNVVVSSLWIQSRYTTHIVIRRLPS